VKLGLMTAALPGSTLEEVADWASQSGFGALEVACWPASEGKTRRYAGVTHVDVERLDEQRAAAIRELLARRGLEISSLAYYPNHMDPDPVARREANDHLRRVIDAAALLRVEVVGTFAGADRAASDRDNMRTFRDVWPPLVAYAAERGVRIAMENCPMIFSYDEWPGGTNVARSPSIWREMFAICPENLGLNIDPSHLVWQMIDYERAVYEFGERIYHAHAKDMEIRRDGLWEHGVMSAGMGWQVPRLPGLGEVRWDRFVAALYAVGYDHVLSIEHEDRRFEGSEDLVKRGFELSRNVLAPLLV
jgi:sugar phosphate isomerase/epimerase